MNLLWPFRLFPICTCVQLMNDLEAMKDGEEQYVVTSHKEERHTCIKVDAADRMKSIYIDVESDKASSQWFC